MEFRNEYTYELIEDFLLGNLSPQKVQEVENLLQTTPGFAEEVEWMKTMLDLPQRQKEMQVLQGFRQYSLRSQMKVQTKRRWMLTAFAASVLLGVLFWQFAEQLFPPTTITEGQTQIIVPPAESPAIPPADTLQKSKEQPLQTAPPLLKTTPRPPETRQPAIAKAEKKETNWQQFVEMKEDLQTLGEEENQTLGEALTRIDKGERKEALPFLERYLAALPEGEDDIEYRIETGKIYLRVAKNPAKAAFHFQTALDHAVTDSDKAAARFYLAISDLAAGKTDSAKKILEEIVAQDLQPWKDKAAKALAVLK